MLTSILLMLLFQNLCLSTASSSSLEGVQFMLYTNENNNGLDITTNNHDSFKLYI